MAQVYGFVLFQRKKVRKNVLKQLMRETGFCFKAPVEGNPSKRGDWWQFCVSFQLEEMHGCCAQLQTCAMHIILIEQASIQAHYGTLPSCVQGLVLAGDKVLSLSGVAGCQGIAAAERAGRKRMGEEEEEEQNSSCTCSHKSSLFNSLGNSHSTKFRGSLHGANLAPAGEERKLIGKKKLERKKSGEESLGRS